MCSRKWPELLGTDAVDVMADAVTAVAAKSFFAVAERCDEQRFAALAGGAAGWWVVSVRFTEAAGSGEVSCTFADNLAHALFDAFTGRDPQDPPPNPEALVDLIGEFSNMIGGTWLTRLANHQTFTLSPPVVRRRPYVTPQNDADARVLLTVNDLPLAVEVRIAAHVDRSATPSPVAG
jgi:hypothetical protein